MLGSPDIPNDHPIELTAPPIGDYARGNTGIPYYTTFDSGRPGPHVLINAVTHGNELCGAIAVDWLFRRGIRPAIGTLTLGFANVAAYLRFDAQAPSRSRYVEEDLNRVWDTGTLDGPRQSIELTRAREIRPLIDTVDLLFDIHSMQNKTAPLMLCGPHVKGHALARRVGTPRYIVADSGHAAGRRLRDYGRFGDPDAAANALLIECGQHWEAAAGPIAVDSALRFLAAAGQIDLADHADALLPLPDRQEGIEVVAAVTIETDAFRFARPFTGMEDLGEGDVIGTDGDRTIAAPHDGTILIMPTRRLLRGQTAVRLGRRVG